MARKTIEVGPLLSRLNYFLASDKSTADEREVMCQFVEGILHDTGNYRGYRYLDTSEIDGNGTRRYYFVSGTIDADYEANVRSINKILV
jgi:hypothetical protein